MSTATDSNHEPTPAIREWAARVAATLPPFTAEEARAAGRLAAALTAVSRHTTSQAADVTRRRVGE